MKSTAKRDAPRGAQRAARRYALWVLGALVLTQGAAACKRVNEGEHPQTQSSTSGQISNGVASASPQTAQPGPASGTRQ
ncbi:hypothetical protein C7401_118119 [Paraburkholderia unamae]|uniref:hypothetical protein n=1 Tax=Paraburkholderia unamae TaxID=219649 RepID=UPI000DC3859D|nr:hypothetical protein [Paraburkholderia unamae]RAR56678.1 hypothetical protein C7401_118119 [Paraburkholderia unamae]